MERPEILLIDNYDSFTFNVKDYLERAGGKVEVCQREETRPEDWGGFKGIVFSPGPGNPELIPLLNYLVESAVLRFPVLGICLGFQAIGFHFGARIIKGTPTHGKISRVFRKTPGRLTEGLPPDFEVVRYHSLQITDLPSELPVLLKTEADEVMAFEHSRLPVCGVQFHPEAHLTQSGIPILQNWLRLC